MEVYSPVEFGKYEPNWIDTVEWGFTRLRLSPILFGVRENEDRLNFIAKFKTFKLFITSMHNL